MLILLAFSLASFASAQQQVVLRGIIQNSRVFRIEVNIWRPPQSRSS